MQVADIARIAVSGVASAISDAVHDGILTPSVETRGGVYDTEYGETLPLDTEEPTYTGRVVVQTTTPPSKVFPDFVVEPGDQLVLLEGFSAAPVENWSLRFAGKDHVVGPVQDIMGAGTLFYAVAKPIPSAAMPLP